LESKIASGNLLTLDDQIDTTAGTVKTVAISDKDDGAALEAIRKQSAINSQSASDVDGRTEIIQARIQFS
jgi:hypothetical protein